MYWHIVYLVLKVLMWEICNIKSKFAKKVIIQSQITINLMCGLNFYETDVIQKLRILNLNGFSTNQMVIDLVKNLEN